VDEILGVEARALLVLCSLFRVDVRSEFGISSWRYWMAKEPE